MPELEKVIEGLEACNRKSGNGSDCQNCPYYDDEDASELPFGVCNIHDMLDDALTFLKSQIPRVMTLEEVREDHDRVVWIECEASKTQNIGQYRGQVYWHNSRVGMWERFVTMSFASDYLHRKSDKYGKTWRCWTSHPSPEQMASTPWDVSPEVRKKWKLDDEIADGIGHTFSPD